MHRLDLAIYSIYRHLEPEMSVGVPVDPPKILQRWGLCNFKASGAQGLLDSMGSFSQLILTFSLFALAVHLQRER